jgi:hypothetical protein
MTILVKILEAVAAVGLGVAEAEVEVEDLGVEEVIF